MIRPIVSTKFALPFVAAGAMMLGACQSNYSNKLHDYMAEKGYTQYELDSFLETIKRNDRAKETVVRQSTVDSIAYRDLFNASQIADDSSALSELNKLAARASIEECAKEGDWGGIHESITLVRDNAAEDGAKISETDELNKILKGTISNFGSICSNYAKIQAYSDMYFYGKFFANKGLFEDTAFVNNFNKTADFLTK